MLRIVNGWRRRLNATHVVVSMVLALLLVFFNYCLENYPFPLFDDIDTLGVTEFYTHRSAGAEDGELPLYLNVGFDKVLVPVTDGFGDTVGNTTITDRGKLLELLRIARKANYKFFVLDVRFETGMTTPSDSALWSEMSSLPNFAYSVHEDTGDAAGEKVKVAGAYSDYGATLTTGFSRWQLLRDSGESMPLRIYEAVDRRSITKRGILYFDNGRLCRNAPFIPLPSDLMDSVGQNHEIRYPLLGGEVMRWNDESEIARMMENRIVIVGDFVNDIHDSYVGSAPGPAIIYHTYELLHRQRHIVNRWLVFIMFTIYAVTIFLLLSGKSLWDGFPAVAKHPVLKFILSFIGWNILLVALNILLYVIWKESYIAFLPAFIFTLIENYRNIPISNSSMSSDDK